MINIEVSGLEEIRRITRVIETELAPERLALRAVEIAREAGQILLIAATRAVIEAVYDHPNFPGLWSRTPSDPQENFGGNEAYRMNDLLDAHHLREEDGGLVQVVEVDPNRPVSINSHPGREMVIDYAIHVHDGYVQWVYGHNTGVFHPGRFWMRVAEIEAVPVIMEYVAQAFSDVIEKVVMAA